MVALHVHGFRTGLLLMETWWYFNEVSEGIEEVVPSTYKLYSDLEGCRTSDNPQPTNNALPPELLWVTVWPNIVILSGSDVLLLELTVPHNSKYSSFDAH